MPEKSDPLKDFNILEEVRKLEGVERFQRESGDVDPEEQARETEVSYSHLFQEEILPIRKSDQLRESLIDMGRSLRQPSTYFKLTVVCFTALNAEFFLCHNSIFSGIVAGALWTISEITYSHGGKPENPLNKRIA